MGQGIQSISYRNREKDDKMISCKKLQKNNSQFLIKEGMQIIYGWRK